MSIIDTLITDRTGGGYGYTDLNRVGAAVVYLANRMAAEGYPVNVNPKTNWTQSDFVFASAMERYLNDVQSLKAALRSSTDVALPDSMNHLSVDGANSIERFLLDLEAAITRMLTDYIYCGETYCGEGDYI